MGFLLLLFLAIGAFVLLPLLFLKMILHVTLGLAVLPFKLLGVVGRIVGVFVKLAAAAASLLLVAAGLVLGVVLVPLLPLLFLAGMVWLAVRLVSPRPARHLV